MLKNIGINPVLFLGRTSIHLDCKQQLSVS